MDVWGCVEVMVGNKVMFGWMWSGGGMCVAVGWVE